MKRLLSLLAHASTGRHSPIFSATNRLLACVPIPEGCLRAPLQRHEDRLCAACLQNWTGLFLSISVQSFSEEKRNSEGFCPAYV